MDEKGRDIRTTKNYAVTDWGRMKTAEEGIVV